uniref:Putative primase n=1 Tax=viral metagenome TaxID=1070528 RepID=A0A6M3JKI5_9ZZZZ
MATRKLPNWLKALAEYVEETEAPRHFWIWGGISTIASALQRKVWLPYGMENIYPNLYIMIVAPPASRKAGPPTFSKKILEDIQIPVAVDSSSKRALTQELAEVAKTEYYIFNGKQYQMAALSIVSKEMSDVLTLDPKGMIEILTSLYDSHDKWKYKTSGSGQDYLYNVCLNCFFVTTPKYLVNNLPEEAIGGGFTSRFVIIAGSGIYKLVPIPPEPPKTLYQKLAEDLSKIANLTGPFEWGEEAKEHFETWYRKIPDITKQIQDDRVHPFLGRIHVAALKVAMALQVAASDELVITPENLTQAIELVQAGIPGTTEALGGHGRSKLGPDTQRIEQQVLGLKEVGFKELFSINFRYLSLSEFEEVLKGLEAMGKVSLMVTSNGERRIKWRGKSTT